MSLNKNGVFYTTQTSWATVLTEPQLMAASLFQLDRGDWENEEQEEHVEAVCCEAPAGDLHDVLGRHLLSRHPALALQDLQELLQPDRWG